MSKTPFKIPSAHPRLNRNAFDLSRHSNFTVSAGMLLPVFVEHVNPDEHFEIRPTLFARTQTLNTAAYVRMKQKVEFFFVPYRLLWSRLPQLLVNTKYNTSNRFKDDVPSAIPSFQLHNTNTLAAADVTTPSKSNGYYETLFMPNTDHPTLDDLGYSQNMGIVRMLDMLNYGAMRYRDTARKKPLYDEVLDAVYNVYYPKMTDKTVSNCKFGANDKLKVNPLAGLAYQKVYQDFYRNPLYEAYDAVSCNMDQFDAGADLMTSSPAYSPNSSLKGFSLINKYFKLRYCNWKKDYFTQIRPTFAGAEFMSGTFTSPVFPATISGSTSFNLTPNSSGAAMQSRLISSVSTPASGTTTTIGFTINNLRSAYALDKLMDFTQRAKNGSYKEQIASHFGFDLHADSTESMFIGGIDAPITIGEVTATAAGDNGADNATRLGQIAGKGTSLNHGTIRFDTREHGIIIGILSIVPESSYNAFGISAFNAKIKYDDFFIPEFDSLGFVPKLGYELDSRASNSQNLVLGYGTRYGEYKTRVDEVHGLMRDKDSSLSTWVAPRVTMIPDGGSSIFSNGIPLKFLKVDPSILDNVFYFNYKGSESQDQFLFDAQFDCKCVRPMSVNGLPNLG